jgi:hypothetical protein
MNNASQNVRIVRTQRQKRVCVEHIIIIIIIIIITILGLPSCSLGPPSDSLLSNKMVAHASSATGSCMLNGTSIQRV